jgi:hypothetical protein
MSDEATPAPNSDKRPQERSPSFPNIGLTKAVERTEQLHSYAKRHDIRVIDAAKPVWDMGPKSSSTLQTVAALLAFGLVESSGGGDGRKIKLSDVGYRAVADPRPGVKEAALRELALKPKVLAEFRQQWGADRPADIIALADLTVDRGFTPEGARAFLRVYDDTIRYAADTDSDRNSDFNGLLNDAAIDPPGSEIAVGDLVRVEHGGQIVFETAKVRALYDHGGQSWAYVEESESAAPMSDLTLLEKAPASPVTPPPPLPMARSSEPPVQAGEGMDRFTVDEGVVKITFPAEMTTNSVADLEDFFALFIKKAKRRAGAG